MMALKATDLLKRLEPAVRPVSPATPAMRAHGPLESQSFDQLLALANKGAVHSGRQIEMGFDAQPPLEPSQLERLAAAADMAEAAGAKRVTMLIDGRGFILDVPSRTLTAELAGGAAASVYSVDAAVFVGSDDEPAESSLLPPGNGLLPHSVLKQLLSTSEAASGNAH